MRAGGFFRKKLFPEVAADALVVWGHGVGAFFPVHGADFAVLFEVLEGVDDAEALADGASEWHVVDDLVADDALFVDEEESAVGDEFAFDLEVAFGVNGVLASEDVVVFGDGFVDVGDDGVGNAVDAALIARGLEPGPVAEFGVGGAADDGDVAFFEFREFFLEADEFGGADEGEVFGVEEEHDVFFAFELLEGEVFEDGFAFNGFGGEGGCLFSYEYGHGDFE